MAIAVYVFVTFPADTNSAAMVLNMLAEYNESWKGSRRHGEDRKMRN